MSPYGSLKIEQGENIYYFQRQMGHSSIQVTIGHLLEPRKPEAAAKTDRMIFRTPKEDDRGGIRFFRLAVSLGATRLESPFLRNLTHLSRGGENDFAN
jgi:hypothetical protein